MRTIAICTPLKGEIPMSYHRNLIRTMTAKLGIAIVNLLVEGIAVHWARNIAVFKAKKLDCRELVFIDKDLDVPLEALQVLLAHEHEDIVCGTYSERGYDTRFLGKPWMGDGPKKTEKGLMRMHQCPIGFCKIRMSVFDRIRELNPDRTGLQVDTFNGEVEEMFEFFPMELVGANTPKGRLDRIATLLDNDDAPLTKLVSIRSALTERSKENTVFLSEDYGFCRLAREAGIPILMDPGLTVQHEAKLKVPIQTDELLGMLREPWRKSQLPEGVILP